MSLIGCRSPGLKWLFCLVPLDENGLCDAAVHGELEDRHSGDRQRFQTKWHDRSAGHNALLYALLYALHRV
jgi:hypothetical protein